MKRALLLFAAFGALLCAVPGYAQLAPAKTESGDYYIRQLISFPAVDSTTVDGSGDPVANESTINDSLWFATKPFSSPGPWTQLHVNFLCHTKDTATVTGLAFDSVTIRLQGRNKSDSVKYWRTLATTAKQPMKAWDSTGTAAARAYQEGSDVAGSGLLTSIPASGAIATAKVAGFGGPYRIPLNYRLQATDVDSTACDEFRFEILYNAEPDSLESFCVTHSTPMIHIMEKLIAVIRFHLR